MPDYTLSKDDGIARLIDIYYPVLEIQPVESCVPSGPVRVRVKRVLFGNTRVDEEILFCDHYNPNPQPMYADKTYVVALQTNGSHQGYGDEYRPIDSINSSQYDHNGKRLTDSVTFDSDAPWSEVSADFYSTPVGLRWLELAVALEKTKSTIPVVPTDSTGLLVSFYNGNAHIIAGRDITEEEYCKGQNVCLIRKNFAELNKIAVGDELQLALYYADYRNSSSRVFSPTGTTIGVNVGLLNANGKGYTVFQNGTYIIVGVYEESTIARESSGYDMGGNAVIIPALSVKNSDENNVVNFGSMRGFNTVFQIPNGTIETFLKSWEAQGVDGLDITFYDKGYTNLKTGLDMVKGIAFSLLIAGSSISVLILVFFCHLFIGKQKKRTAVERSLGMTKGKCTRSLLYGIMLIVFLGSTIGSITGYFLLSGTMERFIGQAQVQAYDTSFSNWVNSSGKDLDVEIKTSTADPLFCFYVGSCMILFSAGIALTYIRGNIKAEPLKLLSTKEM